MKILSVKFKNINSLKGEHFIDFTDPVFVRNPLFAITGPTGSGKTTLLDVISLALFEVIPRLGKISKTNVQEQGAVLTRGQTEAFACVNYECNQGKFSSIWNIHKARSGTVQNSTMEIYRLETGERLDLKKSDVPLKNEELIGLKYDQFIKSVLLAQGDFAKFLKATRQERGELLENITGTGIYRQIGALAYQTYAEKKGEIRDRQNILENAKENLLSEENLTAIKNELKSQEEIKSELEKKLDVFKKEIEIHSEIKKIKDEIQLQNEELSRHEKTKDSFDKEKGNLLKNHENVSLYGSELNSWKNIREGIRSLTDHKNSKEKESQNLLNHLKIKFEQIKKFVKEEFESSKVEENLSLFYEKVNKIITEKESLNNRYAALWELFKVEIRAFNTKYSVKEMALNPSIWEEIRQEVQREKEGLKTFFKEEIPTRIEEEIFGLEEFLDGLNQAILEQQKIAQLEVEIKKNQEQKESYASQIKAIPDEIEKTQNKENILKKEVENLRLKRENQILKANLEEHRHRLKDGEACPLCGALEHPFANEKVETQSFDEDLKQKEKQLSEVQKLLTHLCAQQELWLTQLKNVEEQWKLNVEKLEGLEKNFQIKFSESIPDNQLNLSEEIKITRLRISNLKKLKDFNLKEEAIKRAQPLFDELQEIIQKGKEKSQELAGLYDGKNLLEDVRKFEGDWARLKEQFKGIKKQLEEIAGQIEQQNEVFEKSELKLLPILNKLGFSKVAQAVKVLMPEEEYQQLKNRIQKLKDQIQIILAQQKVRSANQVKLQEELKTTYSKEELLKSKSEMEAKQVQIQDHIEDIRRKIKNDIELRGRVEKLEEEIGLQIKKDLRWKLLNKMIGDSTGNKFNLFAQDLTLKHLLKLANQRLKGINNRYELRMLPGMSYQKDNLVLIDKDMGGQERSVQTLSGGETFLMSLGLALALSDLAAHKISINSLFIDEGFGTLDPETLDQTLDTLERLQAYSTKTIGIISHVEALKERIGTQIQLTKTGQGYSEMKIISL